MQRAIQPPGVRVVTKEESPRGIAVSAQMVVYLALFTLALLLRVIDLDSVPLMQSEAPQALAAWRAASPWASGQAGVAPSALLFVLQTASFAVIGGTELAARLATALAGAFLVVSPALFIGLLGRGRALVLSVLLLCSPVLLTTSRFSSPAVWSVLLVTVALWGVWRWNQTAKPLYAVLVFIVGGALLFLTEPGGPVLALIVVVSWLVARALRPTTQEFDFDDEPADALAEAPPEPQTPRIPWQTGLASAALVVIAVATGFMLRPEGLSAIGETVAGALRGFVQGGGTPMIAFINSVFSEPFTWLLGIVAAIVMTRQGVTGFVDRFLVIWALVGTAFSLVYAGATADHALWTVIPLTVLVSRLAVDLLSANHYRPDDWSVPYWARGVMALVTLALLAIFTMALQMVARAFSDSPDGTFASASLQQTSLVLLAIPIVFLVVVYFMAVNLWNSRTGLQGITRGVLVFGLVTSLGTGWAASVAGAENSLYPAHLRATSADVFLMRQTLFDVANRQSGGFSTMPIVVQAEQDSVTAWVVRDFVNARFVDDPNAGAGEGVVITTSNAVPDLGGGYVGQDFMTEEVFDLQNLLATDVLQWWTQRAVGRFSADTIVPQTAYLWLRQDVYDGVQTTFQIGR